MAGLLQALEDALQENRNAMGAGIGYVGLFELLSRHVRRPAGFGVNLGRVRCGVDGGLDGSGEIGQVSGKGVDKGLERVDERPGGCAG